MDANALFQQIVKDYSERIWWVARRFVNSHEDADDLTQDIFMKIWTALPSFKGEAQVYTWVYRIAVNEAKDRLRREKVRAALRFTPLEAEMGRRIDNDPWFNGSAAERALSKAVAKLPDKQREVFILRYYDEMPYEEMSTVLETSVGALKASYHLAREKVEAALKEDAAGLNL
jgi:RNA polymerase sigma-70 factor (ECF subfamily)